MSRIFRISGNFNQYGKWSKPDPSFAGKIVVDDDGEFRGYCDELYESRLLTEVNKTRFLVGALVEDCSDERRGICFYKLSNDKFQAPLMYIAPDLDVPDDAEWFAMQISRFSFGQEGSMAVGQFAFQGEAKLFLVEEEFSEEEEKRIKDRFGELKEDIDGVDCNGQLLEQVHCCKDFLTEIYEQEKN